MFKKNKNSNQSTLPTHGRASLEPYPWPGAITKGRSLLMGWFSFRWITVPSEWILVESLVEKNFEGQGTRDELARFQEKTIRISYFL